jgi:hypothetical protein
MIDVVVPFILRAEGVTLYSGRLPGDIADARQGRCRGD